MSNGFPWKRGMKRVWRVIRSFSSERVGRWTRGLVKEDPQHGVRSPDSSLVLADSSDANC